MSSLNFGNSITPVLIRTQNFSVNTERSFFPLFKELPPHFRDNHFLISSTVVLPDLAFYPSGITLCTFSFLAAPHSMWKLRSPSRLNLSTQLQKPRVLTTGPPGKSPICTFFCVAQPNGFKILHDTGYISSWLCLIASGIHLYDYLTTCSFSSDGYLGFRLGAIMNKATAD